MIRYRHFTWVLMAIPALSSALQWWDDLLMEALHVALSIECLSQPHKSQQYSWSDLEAIDSDRQ